MKHNDTKRRFPGLGARVKHLRTTQGLTLQIAATRGGTTPQTLVQLERHDLATTRTLNCVARGLGVDVDTLTGRRAS
jgi:transcriptional regulator with XRE-family HTH domain